MTHPLKIQYKLERQAQKSAQRTARIANRRELRQQRLQLKHERELRKIESGYYHKRAEELAKVGQPFAEALGNSLAPIVGTIAHVIKK